MTAADRSSARVPLRQEGDDRLQSLSGDPLYSAGFLSFADTQLAGRVETHIYARSEDEWSAAVLGHEYLDRIPLTFHLPSYLNAVDVDVDADVVGGRWLVLGTPVRFRSGLLGDPGELARLVDDLVDGAREDGFDGVVVPWVENSSADLCDMLADAGFQSAFYDADWYFDTGGYDSVEELIASLPRVPRRNFTNDRKRFEQAAIKVREFEVGDESDVIAMHAEFMAAYGHPVPEFADSAFAQFAGMGGGTIEVAVDERGLLLGFVMMLSGASSGHVLRWGRRQTAVDARIYANLGYHRPLENALRNGVERVWFGKNAHEFKRLRGLTPQPASVWAKALHPAAESRLSIAMKEADAAYRARYERLTGSC